MPRIVHLLIAAATLAPAQSLRAPHAHAAADEAPARPKAIFKRDWTWARSDTQHRHLRALADKPAPALTVGKWKGKGPSSLAELKGKIVLIDFWATWCGPCIASVPHTNEIMDRYSEKGVVVLGVCGTTTGKGGPMVEVAERTGMKFPTAQDQQGTTAGAWGVKWWPFYVIVDREGVVRAAGLKPDSLESALDEMLKEQPGDG